MSNALQVIFRRITRADFFNIYKPPGAEAGGGGQSYIDFDTSGVSVPVWEAFLAPAKMIPMTKGRPMWAVKINSIGVDGSQEVRIGQRRDSSVSIRSQKIQSLRSNRVRAWHPSHTKFPAPSKQLKAAGDEAITPLVDGLVIFLVRDNSGSIWAGWFKRNEPAPSWKVDPRLARMFTDGEGHINLGSGIPFQADNTDWPFGTIMSTSAKKLSESPPPPIAFPAPSMALSEGEILDALFNDDEIADAPPATKQVMQKIRIRNTAAVKLLKKLYAGRCQITDAEYIFEKADGVPYTEAHHLIPLGMGGADHPHNLIVVSAHMHRMLHYAKVLPIDPSKIKDNKLEIVINSKVYTITWHPKHSEIVESAVKKPS